MVREIYYTTLHAYYSGTVPYLYSYYYFISCDITSRHYDIVPIDVQLRERERVNLKQSYAGVVAYLKKKRRRKTKQKIDNLKL